MFSLRYPPTSPIIFFIVAVFTTTALIMNNSNHAVAPSETSPLSAASVLCQDFSQLIANFFTRSHRKTTALLFRNSSMWGPHLKSHRTLTFTSRTIAFSKEGWTWTRLSHTVSLLTQLSFANQLSFIQFHFYFASWEQICLVWVSLRVNNNLGFISQSLDFWGQGWGSF